MEPLCLLVAGVVRISRAVLREVGRDLGAAVAGADDEDALSLVARAVTP